VNVAQMVSSSPKIILVTGHDALLTCNFVINREHKTEEEANSESYNQ